MKKVVFALSTLALTAVAGVASADPTCVTIQRGVNGTVADSDICPSYGNWAAGTYPQLKTGGGEHHSLLQFDLASIPADANVVSAKLTVYQQWSSQSATVNGHQILQPWSEETVSWANFGNPANWSAAVAGSFATTDVGYREMNLTGLVSDWVAGAQPNYGVVIEEAAGTAHGYNASESSSAAKRPSLTVCYEVASDPCAPNPCQNGGECVPDGGDYACACPTGWTGTNCETDIDECAGGDPCNTGSAEFLFSTPAGVSCTNTPGSYTCECGPLFGGAACNVACPCFGDAVYVAGDFLSGILWGAVGTGQIPGESCETSPELTQLNLDATTALLLTATTCTLYADPDSATYTIDNAAELQACQKIIDVGIAAGNLTCSAPEIP